MFRAIIILIVLIFCNPALTSTKEDIISKMQITQNLSFNFIQTVDDKSENGKCTLEYPKKIYCEYESVNKKIIVSNGRSLVIKIKNGGNYYIYPLEKTPLEYLLDKEYLISKIQTLEPKEIDNKYINFKISENNNEINVFFDKKNLNLIGWQTEDIYQELTITFISLIARNQIINQDIFKLPSRD